MCRAHPTNRTMGDSLFFCHYIERDSAFHVRRGDDLVQFARTNLLEFAIIVPASPCIRIWEIAGTREGTIC